MNLERYQRIQQVLKARQPDLTLCLEEVHKPNNVSAVIRTADATGLHKVHAVWPTEQMRTLSHTSAGARNWVEVDTHDTIEDAVCSLKTQGMQVLVTNLSDKAVDFREIDYTKPTAVILGSEKFGASKSAIELADQDIIVPMMGMVQSLNVSVASAIVLYEAQSNAKKRACTIEKSVRYQRKLSIALCSSAVTRFLQGSLNAKGYLIPRLMIRASRR